MWQIAVGLFSNLENNAHKTVGKTHYLGFSAKDSTRKNARSEVAPTH